MFELLRGGISPKLLGLLLSQEGIACGCVWGVYVCVGCVSVGMGVCVGGWGCVRPGIQSEDQNQFFTFKVRTFWQSEVKISVLALWLCALSSLCHNMGVGGYGRNPLFVRARYVQRCVKKCPHFECVIHRFVLALNAGTNTLYTRVYIVSSLWMPGQVWVCVGVWGSVGVGVGVCVCVCFDSVGLQLNFPG